MRGTAFNGVHPGRIHRGFMVLSRRPHGRYAVYQRILSLLAIEDALVPQIWGYEIANSIFVSCVNQSRISEGQIAESLRMLGTANPVRDTGFLVER